MKEVIRVSGAFFEAVNIKPGRKILPKTKSNSDSLFLP